MLKFAVCDYTILSREEGIAANFGTFNLISYYFLKSSYVNVMCPLILSFIYDHPCGFLHAIHDSHSLVSCDPLRP